MIQTSRIAPGQVKYSFVLLFSKTVLLELLEKQQRILYVMDLWTSSYSIWQQKLTTLYFWLWVLQFWWVFYFGLVWFPTFPSINYLAKAYSFPDGIYFI